MRRLLQALSNTDVSGGHPVGDKVVIPKVGQRRVHGARAEQWSLLVMQT